MDESGQKVQTFSYKIITREVMCNMIKIINTAILYVRVVERVSPRSSHHKERIFFSYFLSFFLSFFFLLPSHCTMVYLTIALSLPGGRGSPMTHSLPSCSLDLPACNGHWGATTTVAE